MKMIKTMMASVITMALFSLGNVNAATTQGQGVINFKGTVLNAPCGIAADKDGANVEVDFGQVSKAHLAEGSVDEKEFSIKLTHCDVSSLKKGVSVLFLGNAEGGAATELPTAGPTNTAIILSGYGSDITLGTATPAIKLAKGDNILKFSSRLKQAEGKTVSEGDFAAVANFSLAYE